MSKASERPEMRGSLDLRALQIFTAVCNMRSMSKAAQQLNISQGAVSQQIAKLEASFGLRLLARRGREVEVLPAGINLLFHARRILQDVLLCEQSLRRFKGYAYPKLSITIINTMSKTLSLPIIEGLDGIVEQIHLHTSVSLRHAEELLADETDILISALRFDPETYEIHRIASEPLVLIAPAGFLTTSAEIDLADLARHLPFAHFSERRRIGALANDYLQQSMGFVPCSLEFDQTTTMIDAVRRGAAWGIATPFCLLDSTMSSDEVDVRALPSPAPRRTINLICKRGRFGTMPAQLATQCKAHLEGVTLEKLAPLMATELLPAVLY